MTKMISLEDVMKMTTFKRSSIYSMRKRGEFPQGVMIGKKKVAWREEEVKDWLSSGGAPSPANKKIAGVKKEYTNQFAAALISSLNGILASGRAPSASEAVETARLYALDVVKILQNYESDKRGQS